MLGTEKDQTIIELNICTYIKQNENNIQLIGLNKRILNMIRKKELKYLQNVVHQSCL